MNGSLHAKNQLDSSSRFDTVPACDGRTHDDSIYRAGIASRDKNSTVKLSSAVTLGGAYDRDGASPVASSSWKEDSCADNVTWEPIVLQCFELRLNLIKPAYGRRPPENSQRLSRPNQHPAALLTLPTLTRRTRRFFPSGGRNHRLYCTHCAYPQSKGGLNWPGWQDCTDLTWVATGQGDWLYTNAVCPPKDVHPSQY